MQVGVATAVYGPRSRNAFVGLDAGVALRGDLTLEHGRHLAPVLLFCVKALMCLGQGGYSVGPGSPQTPEVSRKNN